MSGHWQSSYFLEDKSKPLNPKNASLNDSLQTQYIDLDERDDSLLANATRTISKAVGTCCTPRQVLGLLRVLKAITLAFIILTILADLTYMLFVEFLSSAEVKIIAGGTRDTILRIYGLGLSLLGLAIELDYSKVVKKFSGLKGFLPRAILYFFIAQITGTPPMMRTGGSYTSSSSSSNQANGDDAAAAEADDAYAASVDDTSSTSDDEFKIPASAVGFQRVTSFILGLCAIVYLICGLLCFDRFTARAFLSDKDPRVTTAIPQASAHSGGPSEASTADQSEVSVEESTTASSTI